MTLDAGAAALVATMDSYFPALDPTVSGTEMRRRIEAVSSQIPAPPPEPVASVLDRTVPGPGGPIPVRVYRPTGVADGATPPVTMFFHGGGFVICDLDTHDSVCRAICQRRRRGGGRRSTTGWRPSTRSRPLPTTAVAATRVGRPSTPPSSAATPRRSRSPATAPAATSRPSVALQRRDAAVRRSPASCCSTR